MGFRFRILGNIVISPSFPNVLTEHPPGTFAARRVGVKSTAAPPHSDGQNGSAAAIGRGTAGKNQMPPASSYIKTVTSEASASISKTLQKS
jgi:hypothetical protein